VAASLREGLRELVTMNELGLPARLRRCLGSTNLIGRLACRAAPEGAGDPLAGRRHCAPVVGLALAETANSYRRIMGNDQLWMLKAHLDDDAETTAPVAASRQVG